MENRLNSASDSLVNGVKFLCEVGVDGVHAHVVLAHDGHTLTVFDAFDACGVGFLLLGLYHIAGNEFTSGMFVGPGRKPKQPANQAAMRVLRARAAQWRPGIEKQTYLLVRRLKSFEPFLCVAFQINVMRKGEKLENRCFDIGFRATPSTSRLAAQP
jgi:hypothetical protein